MSRYFTAIGLGFSDGPENAPAVMVKGEYGLADTIVALAKKYGVPVVERPELADSLADVPLDEHIPAELYEVAAALLVELNALG